MAPRLVHGLRTEVRGKQGQGRAAELNCEVAVVRATLAPRAPALTEAAVHV